MFRLFVENEKGEQLELTNSLAYVVKSIEGIDPPDAVLNLYKVAGVDGTNFNSATLDNRVITLTLAVNGPAEENRLNLYRFFQTKKKVRLYFLIDSLEVYIDGYGQNMPIQYFAIKEVVQVSIVCNDPYFHLATARVSEYGSGSNALFEFPFEIPEGGIEFSTVQSGNMLTVYNEGNIECGLVVHIKASGSASNPRFYNGNTDQFFGLTTSMQNGDEIIIDTRPKKKSAVRIRSGVRTNLISSRMSGSSWVEVAQGENLFSVSASSGLSNLLFEFEVEGNIQGV